MDMTSLVHDELVGRAVLRPVDLSSAREERAFLDCDLASLSEHRIGGVLNPLEMTPEQRSVCLARATTEPEMPLETRTVFDRCYWMMSGPEIAGTMALSSSLVGGHQVRMSSLYVLPSHRGRGVAWGALQCLKQALARQRLSLRFETSWAWNKTVRYYMRGGYWVQSWRRGLELFWDAEIPQPSIRVTGETASLSVRDGPNERVLVTATRRGDSLELVEADDIARRPRPADWDPSGTLALVVALHGWPLVRSQQHWEASYWAEGGPPEGLAYRIMIWEAWDHKYGFKVDAPRIPTLYYPSWEELEARWSEPPSGG